MQFYSKNIRAIFFVGRNAPINDFWGEKEDNQQVVVAVYLASQFL